ncbi:uncharacterized protein RCC_07613 [Ramularia collo-cygni]|uniref:Uncharacterized protein n=1 Tax=Ramularia collo-cygni TaxID=112498 RepID=A0A2D3V1R4_9PEZI|nr:uncharacterized protein RCC_07613 [Ramularia collo-cygni]CZT21748.1 uncharacterized protein RCC_07613 [Ramularia collo-cygni]
MGLDKFYKTQRKKPDDAKCIECVTRRVNTEPHEVGRDDDEDGYDVAAPGESGSDSDDLEDYHINNATASISGLSTTRLAASQVCQSATVPTLLRRGLAVPVVWT